MKKVLTFIVISIVFLTALSLLIISFRSDDKLIGKLAVIAGMRSKNLLINADFKEKLNGWDRTKSVRLIETNGINCIYMKGVKDTLISVSQTINVISGVVYNLEYDFEGNGEESLVIYRDKKRSFLNCSSKNKRHRYDIKANRTGTAQLYFSVNESEACCYSNISLRKNNDVVKCIYSVISVTIFLLLFVLFLKSNLIFGLITLVFFILPILKIDSRSKSENENRNLAILKPLIENGRINVSFSNNFNEWINDHFFLRNYLIKEYNFCKMLINGRFENGTIFPGKDNFYFRYPNLRETISGFHLNEEEYDKTLQSLNKFNVFCSSNDIDAYIVFIPYNFEIYKEKLNGINIDKYAGKYGETVNRLKNDTGMNLFYPFDFFNEYKNESLLFYKTDHHWTPFGAYKGYRFLINEIGKNYSGLAPVTEEQYHIKNKKVVFDKFLHSYYRELNLDEKLNKKAFSFDDTYFEYEYLNNWSISGKWENVYEDKSSAVMFNKNGFNKKVLLFGDSYLWSIYPFFTHTFSDTIVYSKRLQIFMPDIEKVILQYKPDIVITYIYAGNFKRIKYWYTENKKSYD